MYPVVAGSVGVLSTLLSVPVWSYRKQINPARWRIPLFGYGIMGRRLHSSSSLVPSYQPVMNTRGCKIPQRIILLEESLILPALWSGHAAPSNEIWNSRKRVNSCANALTIRWEWICCRTRCYAYGIQENSAVISKRVNFYWSLKELVASLMPEAELKNVLDSFLILKWKSLLSARRGSHRSGNLEPSRTRTLNATSCMHSI